jgi:G3E family GTPase
MTEPVPVTTLTGFLGAGKTTVLSRLLARPELAGAAVLINEVGEIAIDHHLVREVRGDVTVLGSGCVCCTVRGDLVRALGDLVDQPIDRVLLETSGIADPVGVLATLTSHPVVARRFRPAAIVTAVDGVAGAATLDRHREAVKQAALADRIIITKADLAGDLAPLEQRLRAINRGASITHAAHGDVDPEVLLSPPDADPDMLRWLRAGPIDHRDDADGVRTLSVAFAEPVRLGPLGLWLSMMTQIHGDTLLRIKGIVNIAGDPEPMVVHCVQHVVYPPRALAAWPDSDHRTRLVFVTRGLPASTLASLKLSLAETLGQEPT